MKKTNIRIHNSFIIEDGNSYYLSSITNMDEWKTIDDKDLEDSKKNDVSKKLSDLMEQYEIFSNVNFYDTEEEDVKKIDLEKKGGEWMMLSEKNKLFGGWKPKNNVI